MFFYEHGVLYSSMPASEPCSNYFVFGKKLRRERERRRKREKLRERDKNREINREKEKKKVNKFAVDYHPITPSLIPWNPSPLPLKPNSHHLCLENDDLTRDSRGVTTFKRHSLCAYGTGFSSVTYTFSLVTECTNCSQAWERLIGLKCKCKKSRKWEREAAMRTKQRSQGKRKSWEHHRADQKSYCNRT